MSKEFTVYTKWLAYELRKQGFKFLRADINPNFPQFYCYVFADSAELQAAIARLAEERKKKR